MNTNLETTTDGQIVELTMSLEPSVKTFTRLTPAVDSIPLFRSGSLGYRLFMCRVRVDDWLSVRIATKRPG